MKENRPSDTALGAAVIRAVHQLIDDPPPILSDPVSPRLLAAEILESIKSDPGRHRTPQAKGLRSHVVLRSRYTEDQLQEASANGIRQFINVGAGFDTFAFRQPAWATGLEIIEVDHPASQQAKTSYFSGKGLVAPANTRFVPVDLENDRLAEALAGTGVDPARPTFFACLGVVTYLTHTGIEKTLESVAGMPGARALVVAFASKDSEKKPSEAAQRAAQHGEPWLTYFTRQEIENLLVASGFSSVEFLEPETAAERYYTGRSDLPPPRKTRLCLARV